MRTPSAAAERTAPATVLGMSWNFRSRKTEWPRATSRSTTAGSGGGKQLQPHLEPLACAFQPVHEFCGGGGVGNVERDDQPLARLVYLFGQLRCDGRRRKSDSGVRGWAYFDANGLPKATAA